MLLTSFINNIELNFENCESCSFSIGDIGLFILADIKIEYSKFKKESILEPHYYVNELKIGISHKANLDNEQGYHLWKSYIHEKGSNFDRIIRRNDICSISIESFGTNIKTSLLIKLPSNFNKHKNEYQASKLDKQGNLFLFFSENLEKLKAFNLEDLKLE